MSLYYISDFTIKNYKYLLEKAKSYYSFIPYTHMNQCRKNFVLWRHDVDVSPHRALVLAMAERELNVQATYFFQLNSMCYNIFEKEIRAIVEKIILLNHDIGIHFDFSAYRIEDQYTLDKFLNFEKKIFESLFEVPISVFSIHNPGTPNEFLLKKKHLGMINATNISFKKIPYCSDSNGYWRFHRLEDFLEKNKNGNIHVLTHPEWWQARPMYPYERIMRAIHGRKKSCEKKYKLTLLESGRKNVTKQLGKVHGW